MPLPRDYEKETVQLYENLRAKLSELDLVNAEVLEVERESKRRYADITRLYQEYKQLDDDYRAWARETLDPKTKELAEVRSSIQAMQGQGLTLMIEWMSRAGS